MRKTVFAVFMLITTCILFAAEDYRGGNGTLLREETIGTKKSKSENSRFQIGMA